MATHSNPHNFKPVLKHPKTQPGYIIWRCDNCDSEIQYAKNRSQTDVNKITHMRYPCIRKEFFKQ